MVAAAVAGSAALSAGASLYGSSQAAGAANKAANLQQQRYTTTRNDLMPYNQVGQSAANQLAALNGSGFTSGQPNYLALAQQNMPGQMTEAQLQQTPGYQFNLSQGLQAAQNSAAARGLGVSGAAMKGAASYATGLADSTYQNQFNNAQQNFTNYMNLNSGQQSNATNLYNRLAGTATLGENAAAQTGASGTQAAATAGNYTNQAGQATAAGTAGVGSAATGAANNYLGYNLLQQSIKSNGGQTGGYQDSGTWDQ